MDVKTMGLGTSTVEDGTDQQVLAALVVGVARVLAETNQMVVALQTEKSQQAPGVVAGRQDITTDDWAKRILGKSNVGFFG